MNDANSSDAVRYIPTPEAAERVGLSPDYIASLARNGKIGAQQVGRHWYVSLQSLKSFLHAQNALKEKRSAELSKELRRVAERSIHPARISAAYPMHARTATSLIPPEVTSSREPFRVFDKGFAAALAIALVGGIATVASPNLRADAARAMQSISAISAEDLSAQPAAVVAAIQTAPPSPATTSSLSGATRNQGVAPIIERAVEQPILQPTGSEQLALSDFVTQDELNAQLLLLSNALNTKFTAPATTSIPQNVAADGNNFAPYVPIVPAINNLSGVTITNANLTASEIPPLDYFPASNTISIAYGGTGNSNAPGYGQLLLGNGSGGYTLTSTSSLGISGGGGGRTSPGGADTEVQFNSGGAFDGASGFTFASSTDLLTVTNASTTNLGASGEGYFATASTTNLIVASAPSGFLQTNALGLVTATSTFSADSLFGTVGIGNGGTGTSTAPSYGQLLLGNGSGGYSLVATSSLGITDSGGSAASSTLLSDSNTFSANNLFSASTTFSMLVNISNASTSLATFGSVWLPAIINELLSTNGSGQVVATTTIGSDLLTVPANSLLAGDTVGSLIATTSIGTDLLTGTLGTINGTPFSAGGSITVGSASTTLLGDNNTFTGSDVFASLLDLTSGLLSAASSTIGNGPQAAGLTINGGATTTQNIVVEGTGTSIFAGNIGISGSIVPSADDTYALGSPSDTWQDVYIGPGSLYVNGEEVVHTDASQNVLITANTNENIETQTSGTGSILLNPSGSGNVQLAGPVQLTGGNALTTSNGTPVLFTDGTEPGNLELTGNTIQAVNTNGDISIIPNGNGGTYFTSGNVGIGTTSPSQALSVNGNILAGGNLVLTGTLSAEGAASLQDGGALSGTFSGSPTFSGTPLFNVGLLSLASTTIGGGTQSGGLTVNGGVTTTLGLNIASSTLGLYLNGVVAVQASTTLNNYFFAGATSSVQLAGKYNYAIGAGALANATSSFVEYNFAAGYQALMGNTTAQNTGQYNNAIGEQTLFHNTAGSYNNALGYQSLFSNTTGSSNNALGYQALILTTTGSNNNAFGQGALSTNTTGNNNVAIGNGALLFNTTGSNNVGIGSQSGFNISTGYSNILLGDEETANNLTTGGGNIGIGSNIFFPSATANNQLNIGGIIFGTLPATSTALTLPTTGTIGIGTSSPYAEFSIAANNGSTNTMLFAIGSSTASATTTLLDVLNNGNVGIGNTNPANELTVGSTNGQSNALISARAAGNDIEFGHSNPAGYFSTLGSWSGAGQAFLGFDTEAGSSSNEFTTLGLKGTLITNDNAGGLLIDTIPNASEANQTPTNLMTIQGDGNVGIGTMTPAKTLEVNGTTQFDSNVYFGNEYGYLGFGFAFRDNGAGAVDFYNTSGSVIDSLSLLGGDSYLANGGGDVGIGTTNPQSELHLSTTAAGLSSFTGTQAGNLTIENSNATANQFSTIDFRNTAYTGSAVPVARIGVEYTNIGSDLYFGTSNAWSNGITNSAMVINQAGNVGIGTTTPGAQLDLSSNGGSGLFTTAGWARAIQLPASSVIKWAQSGNTYAFGIGQSSNNLYFVDSTADNNSGAAVYPLYLTGTGNAYVDGCIGYDGGTSGTCLSDERLKANVDDFTDGLSTIVGLNPVTYQYNGLAGTPNDVASGEVRTGLIAQQVQQVAPDLVATTTAYLNASDTTPTTLYEVNYNDLTFALINAVKQIASISDEFEQNLIAWLGNAQNGIGQFFAQIGNFQTVYTEQVCITDGPADPSPVCVTKSQLAALLSQTAAAETLESVTSSLQLNSSATSSVSVSSQSVATSTQSATSQATATPPVIKINGDNPAIVQVGAMYNDLGATITGPQQDLNLGIETFVNGVSTSPVQLDTSQAATDTIDYVVTDENGFTSTSTRTVIVEAPSIVPADDDATTTPSIMVATATDATTTDQ